MNMIEKLRTDLLQRQSELRDELGRLDGALAALGSQGAKDARRQIRPAGASNRAAGRAPRRRDGPPPTPKPQTRSARGATMALVLGALSRTEGRTAGEVAAATGLKRETVSTTLNKLAKTGEAKKASRGYLMASLSASSDAPTAPGSLEP